MAGEISESDSDNTILTFWIADVRGYTQFTRERGDAAAAVLAKKFTDLSREAVEARSGRVIELRGDEALAVFASPVQAVRAAVEFQATCLEESEADPAFPLPVGIGIDSGVAIPVEDGYRGVALNMAARLCSKAAAGQILVSRIVAQRGDASGNQIAFIERDPAVFKGFEQAVDVIEAIGPAQPVLVTGEIAPLDEGLPLELDAFTPLVDREHEMRWLRGTWRCRRHHPRGRSGPIANRRWIVLRSPASRFYGDPSSCSRRRALLAGSRGRQLPRLAVLARLFLMAQVAAPPEIVGRCEPTGSMRFEVIFLGPEAIAASDAFDAVELGRVSEL